MIPNSPLLRAAMAGAALAVLCAGGAAARSVQVTIANDQPAGGLYLTPLLAVFHAGGFDAFDAGAPASAALEALAEDGDPGPLIATAGGAATGVVTAPGGFPGAPVIDPGESASLRIRVDPTTGRYLTFLSMVIPSNDSFIGNDDPMAHEIFDALGVFTRPGPIAVTGGQVWNGGTEVDDNLGAAFNAAGGTATDENGVVGLQPDLAFLLGQTTVAGPTIDSVPGPGGRLATITVSAVPVPAALPLLAAGLAGLALLRRRAG